MNSLNRRLTHKQAAWSFLSKIPLKRMNSSSTSEIQIPKRIERGPTDILKALSMTVSRDPTAPHYKYHDDPYLIPTTNMAKRTYALSYESGKKTALMIRDQNPRLFLQTLSEPEIEAFLPRPLFRSKLRAKEDLLIDFIKQGRVRDAKDVYRLVNKDSLSIETRQALLELLCFYNSTEPIGDELIEERSYTEFSRMKMKKFWKEDTDVQELFTFLKTQDKDTAIAAYNAYLSGLAKYMNANEAWAIYNECRDKGYPIGLTAYNHLIPLIPTLKFNDTERKELLLEIFTSMVESGIKPDVGTLNAALLVASSFSIKELGTQMIKLLFQEFRDIGVKPSLASYYYVLITFCNNKDIPSDILNEILNELQVAIPPAQSPKDSFFFVTAMDVAMNHMCDRDVANKLHALLMTGSNYDFIGDTYKESTYYRHYVSLLLRTEPFEDFMKTYDSLVPNVYIPEPGVMHDIIQALENTSPDVGRELLLRLWSHAVMFGHLSRPPILISTLRIMVTHYKPPAKSPFHQKYADIAWSIWNSVEEQKQKLNPITWQGEMLGDVAVLLARGDEFEKLLEIVSFLRKGQDIVVGILDIKQLEEIFSMCILRGHIPSALDIVEYAVENGYEEAIKLAKRAKINLPLSPSEEDKLISLCGKEIFQLNA